MKSINNILDRIDQVKSELDMLRPFNKEFQNKIEQTFRLRWNYHSNAIEGNKLTLGETKSLILHGLTAKGKPLKDHTDIEGHNSVLLLLEDLVSEERDISENLIRELHQLLLVKPYYVDSIRSDGQPAKKLIELGKYKTTANNVLTSTGETHFYTTPGLVSVEMTDLINWYRDSAERKMHPVLIAAEFHYGFVSIHPFDDGNGRMARILMNMILMKHGYIPAILKIEDRSEYIVALEKADEDSRIPFYEYIASCELASIQDYLKGINGEDIRESSYYLKELDLIERRIDTLHEPKVSYYLDDDLMLYRMKANNIARITSRIAEITPRISKLFNESNFFVINYKDEPTDDDHNFIQFDSAEHIVNGLTPSVIKNFPKVDFYYRFKGIKEIENSSDSIAAILSFKFTESGLAYSLGASNESFEQLINYTEDLSEEQIKTISNAVLDKLMKDIKSLIDQK